MLMRPLCVTKVPLDAVPPGVKLAFLIVAGSSLIISNFSEGTETEPALTP